MSYNLFLDDERVPEKVNWIKLPDVSWVIVRSYSEFVKTILEHGVPNIISFDHDLATEHYQEFSWATDKRNITTPNEFRYDKMQIKTGYDCAKFLVDYIIQHNLQVPEYYLHSWNHIGRDNIQSILESCKKHLTNN